MDICTSSSSLSYIQLTHFIAIKKCHVFVCKKICCSFSLCSLNRIAVDYRFGALAGKDTLDRCQFRFVCFCFSLDVCECVCVWCSDNAFCSLIAIVLSYRARSGDLFEHILSFFLSFISMTAYSQSMRYNYDDNHMYVKCLSA